MSIFFALLLLTVPGYLVTLFLSGISGLFKRVAYTIVISAALEVAVSYLLAVFNPALIRYFLPVITALALVLGFLGRKKIGVIAEEWRARLGGEQWLFVCLLALSLGAGALAYYPHVGYPWPLHADEWAGVAGANSLLSGKSLNTNPYTDGSEVNYKPGFTAFTAAITQAVGADPIRSWPFLPATNLFLVAFTASLLLYERTKRGWIAALAPPLLAALHSNAYVLGWWFFVPSSFAPLFVVFLLLEGEGIIADILPSGLLIIVLVAAALALIYLPFLAIVVIAFLPIAKRLAHTFRKTTFLAALIALVAAPIALVKSPYIVFWPRGTFPLLAAFFVPASATIRSGVVYPLFSIPPFPLFFLGAAGAFLLYRARWSLPLVAAAALTGGAALLEHFTGASFLAFAPRVFYFFAVTMALLSSVALGALLSEKRMAGVLAWVTAIVTLALIFHGYARLPSPGFLYRLVDVPNREALAWLSARDDLKGMRVVSPPILGTIITPLAGFAAPVNLLTMQAPDLDERHELFTFFSAKECSQKKRVMDALGAGLVYGNEPQSCPFLAELYNRNGIYIYERIDKENGK